MKKNIFRLLAVSAAVAFTTSCSKQIDEAYQNPNADVRVPVESLLPHLINCMTGNYGGHGPLHDTRYVGAYIQSFAWNSTLSNFDRMGYTNSTADVAQSTWRMHYYDIGQNNNRMIEWALDEKKWDYAGAGQAIFGWSWLTLADYYGETIVNDAFNTSLATFLYDPQEAAYERAKNYCFAALENLSKTGDNASQANFALGDKYFYNGDAAKWKKFVYGVLARYHNHFSNKASYKADSVIYYANLAMNDNADNAVVRVPATALSSTNSYFGPIRTNLTTNTAVNPAAIRQGAFVANLMNGTNPEFAGVNDPRAWYMLRGNTNGTIKGVEPSLGQTVIAAADRPENFWGSSQAAGVVNTAPATQQGTYLFRNESPVPVLTASEMYFLKAEAYWRKGDKTNALTAYKEGISKNFDMLTTTYNVNIKPGKEITPAVKTAYMADPAVVPTESGLNLSKIMLQKYISLFVHGTLETWLDMRRFHYTDLDPSTGNQVYRGFVVPADLFPDNGGKTVQRMRPRFNSEYLWNIVELERIGATRNDYHVQELWITKP
ncbi:MAG: hypothetical protein EOO06_02935 [Chitinophagaceae bacterium]|nr:MAG: hypothetical protein EOO06_02935 [Chitinophagaceae bacterium]